MSDVTVRGDTLRRANKSDAPLLLGPRIRQRLGKTGDCEIRRRGAVDGGRSDARRNEGEGANRRICRSHGLRARCPFLGI